MGSKTYMLASRVVLIAAATLFLAASRSGAEVNAVGDHLAEQTEYVVLSVEKWKAHQAALAAATARLRELSAEVKKQREALARCEKADGG